VNQLDALEIIRFLLRLNHFFVSLADNRNQQVEHNYGDGACAEEVEQLHHSRCREVTPIHIISAQSDQISLIQEEERTETSRGHNVERESKSAQDQQVQQSEDLDLVHDAEEHIDEESCFAENTQEVENFGPHSEANDCLEAVADAFDTRAVALG